MLDKKSQGRPGKPTELFPTSKFSFSDLLDLCGSGLDKMAAADLCCIILATLYAKSIKEKSWEVIDRMLSFS